MARESETTAGRRAVEYLTRDLRRGLSQRAATAARGRVTFNFHQPDDGYQRMLSALQPGSYIQPHMHHRPAKSESFIVLAGEIGFFQFDAAGKIIAARRLGPVCDAVGVDLEPGVWHCLTATQPDTIIFEGKNGPYDPATDKVFASWAPAEGAAGAAEYLQ